MEFGLIPAVRWHYQNNTNVCQLTESLWPMHFIVIRIVWIWLDNISLTMTIDLWKRSFAQLQIQENIIFSEKMSFAPKILLTTWAKISVSSSVFTFRPFCSGLISIAGGTICETDCLTNKKQKTINEKNFIFVLLEFNKIGNFLEIFQKWKNSRSDIFVYCTERRLIDHYWKLIILCYLRAGWIRGITKYCASFIVLWNRFFWAINYRKLSTKTTTT